MGSANVKEYHTPVDTPKGPVFPGPTKQIPLVKNIIKKVNFFPKPTTAEDITQDDLEWANKVIVEYEKNLDNENKLTGKHLGTFFCSCGWHHKDKLKWKKHLSDCR